MTHDAANPGRTSHATEVLAPRSGHTLTNRAGRAAWAVVWLLLFRPSPRPLHAWRNWLLRLFGARLHPTSRVYPSARVWAPWRLEMGERATLGDGVNCYNVGGVAIGPFTTISQFTHLCGASHDFDLESFPLVPGAIRVGGWCWVAADVFVGPGVTIGEGAVVGARSGVFKDVEPWVVAAGTPARVLRARAKPRAG